MHGLGKRQFTQQLRQGLRQHGRHSLPLLLLHRKQILALRSLSHLQVFHRDALPCGKTDGRSRGLPVLVERHCLRGPHGFFDRRRLLPGKSFDQQHQPPRSAHRTDSAVGETQVFQQGLSRLLQRAHGRSDELIGQFFRSDFQQKFCGRQRLGKLGCLGARGSFGHSLLGWHRYVLPQATYWSRVSGRRRPCRPEPIA